MKNNGNLNITRNNNVHKTDCNNTQYRHMHMEGGRKQIDELLQSIWELREKGKVCRSHYQESGKGKVILNNLEKLKDQGLVTIVDGHVKFTEEGEKRARNIVRRHRLTERMLTDLFEIPTGNIEGTSCELEHILNNEVTDSICSFLGHPTHCPHGKPIPRGECCKMFVTAIRPLVMPLSELMPSEEARITFISTRDKHQLQRLTSLGIIPDARVQVHQKLPAFVIQVGETEIALDRSLVSKIYVKRINGV